MGRWFEKTFLDSQFTSALLIDGSSIRTIFFLLLLHTKQLDHRAPFSSSPPHLPILSFNKTLKFASNKDSNRHTKHTQLHAQTHKKIITMISPQRFRNKTIPAKKRTHHKFNLPDNSKQCKIQIEHRIPVDSEIVKVQRPHGPNASHHEIKY